jgi:outer membrane protein assembly factor BamA
VNLVYELTEAEQFRIGRITIRGNTITQDRVIRRQLRFFPEQLYDTVAVRESRDRLMESRLFDKVTITPFGEEPGVRNALVSVEEARTAEFVVGVGFTTNAGVLGTISFTQRNFDYANWPDSWSQFVRGQAFKGAGQTLRLSIEPGTELVRARIDWREPYLFDRPISLGAGLYLFTRGRESYDETRLGAQSSLGKLFPNRWYGELAVRFENVRIDSLDSDAPPEVIADKGDHALIGFKGTLVRDRTDNRWLPSKGDRLSFGYEQITGSETFGKSEASYSRYYTVYMDSLDRKHILAGRVSGEAIVGDAPVFERYYGGGIGDIRGFQFRGISPRSAGTDEPIGGDFKFYAGTEYTFPIYGEMLRGVLFVDSGTVEDELRLSTYRVSTGFGIRLHIPFLGPVPMSLDFGFPISKDEQDDTQLLSFSFGWVF